MLSGVGLLLAVLAGLAYLIVTGADDRPGAGPSGASTASPQPTAVGVGSANPVVGSGPSPTATATARSAVPGAFVGRWSGIVRQPGGVATSWSVTATFEANWTLIVNAQGDLEMFWQQFGNPDNTATATLVRS